MDLQRANRVTAFWGGDGIAKGVFYKTHTKIATISSDDETVAALGFNFPAGTDEEPATAAQKLEAYKTFLQMNATSFGVTYDPVDRRDEEHRYPSKYDEATFTEYAKKMAITTLEDVLKSVQNNTIGSLIKHGLIPENTQVQYGIADAPEITITESYTNGNIKYATATYMVAIAVNGKQFDTVLKVELVSGQIKKPRSIGDVVLTMTGIKNMLTDAGILPKVEPKAKKTADDADSGGGEDMGADEA